MNSYIQTENVKMSDNKEIFKGKTFQDLTKDIYENTTNKKKQIDLLISENAFNLFLLVIVSTHTPGTNCK